MSGFKAKIKLKYLFFIFFFLLVAVVTHFITITIQPRPMSLPKILDLYAYSPQYIQIESKYDDPTGGLWLPASSIDVVPIGEDYVVPPSSVAGCPRLWTDLYVLRLVKAEEDHFDEQEWIYRVTISPAIPYSEHLNIEEYTQRFLKQYGQTPKVPVTFEVNMYGLHYNGVTYTLPGIEGSSGLVGFFTSEYRLNYQFALGE